MSEADYSKGFERGVLWAVARIVELHGQPVIAADVLRESGYGLDLRRADEADREFLKVLYDEPAFRKSARLPAARG